jgi:hypothetical protein
MTVPERDPYDVLQVSRSAPWPEVRATYRTLARHYHPDSPTPDQRRMSAINAAYERLEREHPGGPKGDRAWMPVGPGVVPGAGSASATPSVRPTPTPAPLGVHRAGPLMRRIRANRRHETPVLDFGRYAGWRIAEVATHDPTYLRWLSRHSSGIRFRSVIEQVLGDESEIGRRAAILG